MDAREIIGDNEEMLRSAIEGNRKGLWTAMVCIVAEDSKDGHTVTVQIAIQGLTNDQTGKQSKVNLPLLQDVPIHYAGGGDVVMTHPVKKGDEGMVIFQSRNQDSWFQSGGVQPPLDPRMHHLADARYVPGGNSIPMKIENVSQTAHEIRSRDGKHKVSLDPASGLTLMTTMAVNIKASKAIVLGSGTPMAFTGGGDLS